MIKTVLDLKKRVEWIAIYFVNDKKTLQEAYIKDTQEGAKNEKKRRVLTDTCLVYIVLFSNIFVPLFIIICSLFISSKETQTIIKLFDFTLFSLI